MNFKKVPASREAAQEEFKWALGNAISIVANAQHFDEVVSLIRDKCHGTARGTLVLRLPRLNPGCGECADWSCLPTPTLQATP
jgi:hypothetical protein